MSEAPSLVGSVITLDQNIDILRGHVRALQNKVLRLEETYKRIQELERLVKNLIIAKEIMS